DKTPDDDTQITFLTDGVSSVTLPGAAKSISVFENAGNVGITAFEIRTMPTAPLAYEGFLEVYNSGTERRSVEITVSGAGQQRVVTTVNVPAGRAHKQSLDLSQFDGGGIRAAVRADGD